MPDLPPYPNNGDESGLPGWVKILGIIALILVLLAVVVMLSGGLGGHTPPAGGH